MSLRLRLALTLLLVAVPLAIGAAFARGALERRSEVQRLHEFITARMVDGRAAAEADPDRFPPVRNGQVPRDLRDLRGPRGNGPGPGGGPLDGVRGGGRGPGGPGDQGAPGGPGGGGRPGRDQDPSVGSPPVTVLFAYDLEFRSRNARAPKFPAELRAVLEGGAQRAHLVRYDTAVPQLVATQRMEWESGPAAIVTATRPLRAGARVTPAQLLTGAALAGLLAIVVFLSAGPIVRRVRQLTEAVQSAERGGYAGAVPASGGDEVALLARAFNTASERIRAQVEDLESRSAALREFVANTTHDMMTPMTVLQGHLGRLREHAGADQRSELLGSAVEEVQYMTSLLANLAASARLETEELPLEQRPVDLAALVERVVARHLHLAKARGIEIQHATPEGGLSQDGDRTLIEQAVSNLVHNAVRYGREGGNVAVLLDGASNGAAGASFELRVIDDGPGIDPALVERLAERSFRTDEARARVPEGQGLGLHIAQEVARRHGWRLELGPSEYGGAQARLVGGDPA